MSGGRSPAPPRLPWPRLRVPRPQPDARPHPARGERRGARGADWWVQKFKLNSSEGAGTRKWRRPPGAGDRAGRVGKKVETAPGGGKAERLHCILGAGPSGGQILSEETHHLRGVPGAQSFSPRLPAPTPGPDPAASARQSPPHSSLQGPACRFRSCSPAPLAAEGFPRDKALLPVPGLTRNWSEALPLSHFSLLLFTRFPTSF